MADAHLLLGDVLVAQQQLQSAIAKYRDVSTVEINGLLTKRPVQFTNVWINQNGVWRIAAEHSSIAEPRELMPRNRFADKLASK